MIGELLNMRMGDAKARATELLEWFDLADAADRMAKTYSGGMRRRLDLAASLTGHPEIVFLDEPTTGLDPAKREDMWDVVRAIVDRGTSVLLTTQYLEEADALADDIVVINHGEVIAHDTAEKLKRVVGSQTLEVRPTHDAQRRTGARHPRRASRPMRPRWTSRAGRVLRTRAQRLRPGRTWWARLRPPDIEVTELSLALPSLDEVFFTLTGERNRSAPAEADSDRGGRLMTTAAATHEVTATIPHGPLDVLRHSWVLAKRSLVKTWRTPEGLIDVTLSPIMFTLLFTYIFGGAIAGSTQDYLPLLVTGLIGQNIAFASVGIGIQLNADIEKGIFDRFKSLPISRIAPLFGAAHGRHRAVRAAHLASWWRRAMCSDYRVGTDVWHFLGGAALAHRCSRLCLAWGPMLIGLIARSQRAVQGIVFMTLFPLTFASNAFVPTESMPELARGVRQCEPAVAPGEGTCAPCGTTRTDPGASRRRLAEPGRMDARVVRHLCRGVRAARDPRLQPQGLTAPSEVRQDEQEAARDALSASRAATCELVV